MIRAVLEVTLQDEMENKSCGRAFVSLNAGDDRAGYFPV